MVEDVWCCTVATVAFSTPLSDPVVPVILQLSIRFLLLFCTTAVAGVARIRSIGPGTGVYSQIPLRYTRRECQVMSDLRVYDTDTQFTAKRLSGQTECSINLLTASNRGCGLTSSRPSDRPQSRSARYKLCFAMGLLPFFTHFPPSPLCPLTSLRTPLKTPNQHGQVPP